MTTPCPHCQVGIEIDSPTLAALAGRSHFACPVCQGHVPVPVELGEEEILLAACMHCDGEFEVDQANLAILRRTTEFPCPICAGMLSSSIFHAPALAGASQAPAAEPTGVASPGWRPPPRGGYKKPQPKRSAPRFQALRGMNRNLLILGSMVLLLLAGLGMFIASKHTGNVTLTREDRVREIINNQYFKDLIASGKADKQELLAMWDIRPYGTGYVGISGKKTGWEQAAAIADRVGATVMRLDPPDSAARAALLQWMPDITADLGGETLWLFDHGKPKVIAASVVNPVTTKERPRRVVVHW